MYLSILHINYNGLDQLDCAQTWIVRTDQVSEIEHKNVAEIYVLIS